MIRGLNISVVILNWNRPQDTISAVDSVLGQDYPDFEVLVWDNASTDNSRAVLEARFAGSPAVRFVWSEYNHGVAGGRNRAFRVAAGGILLSLDSDAVLKGSRSLSEIAAALAPPDVGAVSFEVVRPDGHLMWPFTRPAAAWRSRSFETLRLDGCGFAVKREAFARVDGFAEHFSPYGAEDQHFAWKLIAEGYRILYVPSVTVVHAFAPHGRTAMQFRRHVRNSLWVPLELAPMPHALLSAGKLACSLLRDALEQRAITPYLGGVAEAVAGLRVSRRRSFPRQRWSYLRGLVAEDKRLGHEAARPA